MHACMPSLYMNGFGCENMVLYPFKILELLLYEKNLKELTEKEVLFSVKNIVKGYVFYLLYDKGDWMPLQEIDSNLQNYGFVGDLKAIGLIVATELVKEGKFESKKPELAYKTKI
jgi:hypothetical protein